MGTFSQFLEEKQITPPMILRASARLEASGKAGRALGRGRTTKRRKEPQKSYADAGLAKPPTGRGVGSAHVQAAMKDAPLPRKVRAKLVRAVTALLAKKGGGTPDPKALFGDVATKRGKKVEKQAQA